MNTAMIGGAALAGFLVAGFGPGWAIAFDAGTYLLAAACVALMRLPAVVREHATNFFHELADGWREFRSRTWLWAIVLQFSFMLMVVLGAFSVLGPVVADEELGGATAWGLILTGWSAGLVIGGLVGLRFRPRRMLLAATLAILALPLPLVALGFPLGVPAIAATAFVAGLGIEIFGLLWDTTMQQEIPTDKLSRVYSYDALGSLGLVPLGYALSSPPSTGWSTTATGPRRSGTSTTASRCSCRRRSASTATTCSRSSSATRSSAAPSRASTARPGHWSCSAPGATPPGSTRPSTTSPPGSAPLASSR